jgi:two-component sensor histidine kinase
LVEPLLKNVSIWKQLEIDRGTWTEVKANDFISNVLYGTGLYKNAIVYYKQSMQLIKNDNTKNYYYAGMLNNIGLAYSNLKMNDSALFYVDKAIEFAQNNLSKESNKIEHLSLYYGIKAHYYFEKDDYKYSIKNHLISLELYKKINKPTRLRITYSNLAINYLKINNISKAKKYRDSFFTYYKITPKNIRRRQEFLDLNSAYFKVIKDYKKSLFYLEKLKRLDDSIHSEKEKNNGFVRIANTGILGKESLLKKSKEKIIEIEAQKKEQAKFLVYLIIICFLILVGLIVSYVQFKQKQKSEQKIRRQKKEIEKSLEEKEVLLKEVHHRVKNNLQIVSSLLQLQMNTIEDQRLVNLLREGQNRIYSMSMIHHQLYQNKNLKEVRFVKYLTKLVHLLKKSYEPNHKNINVEINVNKKIKFNINTAIPLGLLISELISNSFKHAFEYIDDGKIELKLVELESKDSYLLTIKDNGMNVKKNLTKEVLEESLGMKLVKILSKQLDGDFNWYHRKGFYCEVRFKSIL